MSSATLGFTTSIKGTSGYLAPEFLVGDGALYDNKVDVWSLGCILYELAAGKRAFDHEVYTLQYKVNKILPAISFDNSFSDDDKEEIQILVRGMLDFDPNARPSARDLVVGISANQERTIAPRPRDIHIYQDFKTSTIGLPASANVPDNLPVPPSDTNPGPRSGNHAEFQRYNPDAIIAGEIDSLEDVGELLDRGPEAHVGDKAGWTALQCADSGKIVVASGSVERHDANVRKHWIPQIPAFPTRRGIPKPTGAISAREFMEAYGLTKEEYNHLRARLRDYFEHHHLKSTFSAQSKLVRVSLKNKPREDLNKAACEVTSKNSRCLI